MTDHPAIPRSLRAGFVLIGIAGVLGAAEVRGGEPDVRLAVTARDHPRLLATAVDFGNLRNRIEGEARMKRVWLQVRKKADRYLDAKPLERKMTGRRLLAISRQALDRILALAMAYQVTGDGKYLDRGIATLKTISAFPDWNPSHFLDVAEMTAAMAIGYDWFYDGMSPELRRDLREAIVEKAFRPSFAGKQWWVNGTNNWNQVCHGGLTLGALAMIEDEPEWAAKVIRRAVKGVPNSMRDGYAPSGTYPEGPGYWNYGTNYNVILIAALEKALGNDFGLSRLPGFDRTGAYINHATGPTGVAFDYADGSPSIRPAPAALFWLARRFDRPDWVTVRLDVFDANLERAARSRMFPLILLWAPPLDKATEVKMALDWKGDGKKPVTMHRSGWGPEATYLGVCAGTASSNHGHMDAGSFIFESQGVRWADDLGSQSYHGLESKGVGLWDSRQNGGRWTIFRLNNFSHNTLTIGGELQRVDGFAPLGGFGDSPQNPFTIVDLSPVYKGQVRKAVRAFHLPKRRHLVISDRITGLRGSGPVTWRMMTAATVTLKSKREALLKRDGKALRVRLLEPASARWVVRDASRPPADYDAPNPGKSLLEFSVPIPDSGDLSLLVVLEPTGGAGLPDDEARKLATP